MWEALVDVSGDLDVDAGEDVAVASVQDTGVDRLSGRPGVDTIHKSFRLLVQ